ncbi:MAG: acetyl-CoA carboxylase biotin carboxyl carrier protein [Gemmatimonadota bacterium]
MIDLRYVKKLIEMLDGSSVDSVEISSDKGMKIRIAKTPQQRGAVQIQTPVSMPALVASPRMTPADGVAVAPEAALAAPAVPKAEAKEPALAEVKSPMVGTFYAAGEPGARPFASVGLRVTKGQVLCIIEAMKIMNEIESEVTGVIRDVLVQDAHPVEYGQVLFRVDPNG